MEKFNMFKYCNQPNYNSYTTFCYRNHSNFPDMFICPICYYKFPDLLNLLTHCKNNHQEYGVLHLHLYKCNVCSAVSTNIANIQEHYLKEHSLSMPNPALFLSIQVGMPNLKTNCEVCNESKAFQLRKAVAFADKIQTKAPANVSDGKSYYSRNALLHGKQSNKNEKLDNKCFNGILTGCDNINNNNSAFSQPKRLHNDEGSLTSESSIDSFECLPSSESLNSNLAQALPFPCASATNSPKQLHSFMNTEKISTLNTNVNIRPEGGRKLLFIPSISPQNVTFRMPFSPIYRTLSPFGTVTRQLCHTPLISYNPPLRHVKSSDFSGTELDKNLLINNFLPTSDISKSFQSNQTVSASSDHSREAQLPQCSLSSTLPVSITFSSTSNEPYGIVSSSVCTNSPTQQTFSTMSTLQTNVLTRTIPPSSLSTEKQTEESHIASSSHSNGLTKVIPSFEHHSNSQTQVASTILNEFNKPILSSKSETVSKYPFKYSSHNSIEDDRQSKVLKHTKEDMIAKSGIKTKSKGSRKSKFSPQAIKMKKLVENKRLIKRVDDKTNFCSYCQTVYPSELYFHNHELASVPKGYITFVNNHHLQCTLCMKTFSGVYYTLRHIALKHEFDWQILKEKVKFCPKLKRKVEAINKQNMLCDSIVTNVYNHNFQIPPKKRKTFQLISLTCSPNRENIYDFDLSDNDQSLPQNASNGNSLEKEKNSDITAIRETTEIKDIKTEKCSPKQLSRNLKTTTTKEEPATKPKRHDLRKIKNEDERTDDIKVLSIDSEDTQPMTFDSDDVDKKNCTDYNEGTKEDNSIVNYESKEAKPTNFQINPTEEPKNLSHDCSHSDKKSYTKKKNQRLKKSKVSRKGIKPRYHTRNTILKYKILPRNPIITSTYRVIGKKEVLVSVKQEPGNAKTICKSEIPTDFHIPTNSKSNDVMKTADKNDQMEDYHVEKLFTGSVKLEKTINFEHIDYKEHLFSLSNKKEWSLENPPNLNPEPEEYLFACNFCERRFKNRLRIISHVRNQHFCGRTSYKLRYNWIKGEKTISNFNKNPLQTKDLKTNESKANTIIDDASIFKAPLPPNNKMSSNDSSKFNAILSLKEPPSLDVYRDSYEPPALTDFFFNQCNFCCAVMGSSEEFLQHLIVNHPGFCRPRSMKQVPKIMLCKLD